MWNLFRAKSVEKKVEELVQQAIKNAISVVDIKPIPEDIKKLKETVKRQHNLGIFRTNEEKEYDWWFRSNYVSKDDIKVAEVYKEAYNLFKSKCGVDIITAYEFQKIEYNNKHNRGDFLVTSYPEKHIPESILDKIEKSEFMKIFIPYTSIRSLGCAYSFLVYNKTVVGAFVPLDFEGNLFYAVVFP